MILGIALGVLVGGVGGHAVTAAGQSQTTLVVHGGAGGMTRASLTAAQQEAYREGLRAALEAGHTVLQEGDPALDAVEAAVATMEADPLFNAGRGAVRTNRHTIELDAALMDGATRHAGAVTGVSTVKHPIRLARTIMTESRHVMLAGDGAEAFAAEQDVVRVAPDYFRVGPSPSSAGDGSPSAAGTVGAVALDADGNLAAATSTGGLSGKHVGRVGDSPIVGAGTYADNASVAVSATGEGAYFMRGVTAYSIAARVRFGGASVTEAARAAVQEVKALGGTGGVIALGPEGEIAMPFTTSGMFRGVVSAADTATVRIFRSR